MNDAENAKYFNKYLSLWAVVVVAGGLILGVGLIWIGTLHGLPKVLNNVLQAVGASVIASLILYVLVSVSIDRRRQKLQDEEAARQQKQQAEEAARQQKQQAEEAARQQKQQAEEIVVFGIEEANRQFVKRFEAALPTAVFEGSKHPKQNFQKAFAELLASSKRYDFKGDSANFTTYRLARCCDMPAMRKLEIRLCILDPLSERAVNVYAEQYLQQYGRSYDEAGKALQRKQIKEDIYVSLWTLYQLRHGLTTSVFFHADLPFFRCEVFDSGMFLTYYLDRRIYPDYPETLQFSSSARPYLAYSSAIAVSRSFSPKMAIFGESGPHSDRINSDDKIAAFLKSLGCQLGPAELDALQEQRFHKFDEWLGEAGIKTSQLF